jgi:hypothetical protein
VVFPSDGPWRAALEEMPERLIGDRLWQAPAFADIPMAGQIIAASRPVLTFFAAGDSLEACRYTLRQMAADLDPWLWIS